jgi:hypothetical protein
MPDHKDSSLLKNVAEPKTSTTKRGVSEEVSGPLDAFR